MLRKIYLYPVFFLIRTCSFAQTSEIITDRPDQTESPFLVSVHHFQLESGFAFERNDKLKTIYHPSNLLRYGATENFELRFNIEAITLNSESNRSAGITPVEAGFKARLCNENKYFPKISIITHFVLPSLASEDFRTSYLAPVIRFAFQNSLSDNVSLGYNLGYEWDGETAPPSFIYSITLGVKNSGNIGSFFEFFGSDSHEAIPVNNLDAGITYLAGQNLQLDLSAGIRLASGGSNYFAGCGFAWRFPKE